MPAVPVRHDDLGTPSLPPVSPAIRVQCRGFRLDTLPFSLSHHPFPGMASGGGVPIEAMIASLDGFAATRRDVTDC